MIETQSVAKGTTTPIRAGDELPPELFRDIRRQMLLEGCKWDPQVGDISTISPSPLLLSNSHWRQLSQLATLLTEELLAAEQDLLHRPELHRQVGLPGGVRSVLRRVKSIGATPAAARVLRFDFHWTMDGWRISEVNSDVPGGFSEASELPALMARHSSGARPAGNPGAAWAGAIAASAPPDRPVVLLAAAGFLEDQQVMAYLGQQLSKLGLSSYWALPGDICWRDGIAYFESRLDRGPIGAIVRFFQAEWLNVRCCAPLFIGGRTPVTNPGIAVLTESKRFPLTWDRLSTALPTWRQILPTTVDPRDIEWIKDDGWLLKSAFCNTGDSVAIRSLLTDDQWRSAVRAVQRNPGAWVAQRRFAICPLESPAGPIYPCVGVYTVDGLPAGVYGRFSRNPLIDHAAVDAAVLITDD